MLILYINPWNIITYFGKKSMEKGKFVGYNNLWVYKLVRDFMNTVLKPNTKTDDKKRLIELELQLEEMTKTVEMQYEQILNARLDALTGLRNRDGLPDQVNAMLEENCEGFFFIMDMDNFKSVNDTYGHLEGDSVLARFAQELKKSIGENDVAARIGGDEFIVFSPESYTDSEIRRKALGIIRRIERALVAPGRLVRVTVSMGISKVPDNGTTYETLYSNADKALYLMKNEGKNGYKFYADIDESENDIVKCSKERASLAEITCKLREEKMEGSFVVEYNDFEKIYRFMERNLMREKRDVQCVLFTVDDDMELSEIALKRHREYLMEAVTSSLRKGDVTADYGSSQVLALLMDVNGKNAEMVIERILQRYRDKVGDAALEITYDIQPVTANE
jgi:diguanylate cyclase (GGDEF)-like protein